MNLLTTKKNISGKVVVITGASSGVGLATATLFAKEGCRLVLASRGEIPLKSAAEKCENLGADVIFKPTDVSVAKQVESLVDFALENYGRIDVWINNAGVMASGKFEDIPMNVNEQVIQTNLMGYMHGAYYVLPVFKKQEEGVLINNVSIGGYVPAPYSAVYSATKFGIKGMMAGLQSEYSVYPNIHICNLYPQIQRSTGNMHSAKYSGLDFKIPPIAADPKDTAQCFVNLAKYPQNDKFPDATSYLVKSIHGIFPQTTSNLMHSGLRLLMKVKNGEDNPGNIFKPSEGPHTIYGETSLSVPSKSTKKAISIGLLVGVGLLIFKALNKKD